MAASNPIGETNLSRIAMDKPPLAMNSIHIHKAKRAETSKASVSSEGNLQRSRSWQWQDCKHLEELDTAFCANPPTLKRTRSLTKLGVGNVSDPSLRKHLSSSNILALSDASLSLKEALPVKVFTDKGSAFGEETERLTNYTQMYYFQLIVGCGREDCSTTFCSSSYNFPKLSDEMKVNASVLLALTKDRYKCPHVGQSRRVLPAMSHKTNELTPRKTNFLTKLFSMSSFKGLFQPLDDRNVNEGRPLPDEVKSNFVLGNALEISSKEESPLQLHSSTNISDSSTKSGENYYILTNSEPNANFLENDLLNGTGCETEKDIEFYSLTHLSLDMLRSVIGQYQDCGDDNFLKATLRTVFASPDALARSFIGKDDEHDFIPRPECLQEIDDSYQMILKVDKSGDLFAEINNSSSIMLSCLRLALTKSPQSVLWPIIIILKNPKVFETNDVPLKLSAVLLELSDDYKEKMLNLISKYPTEELKNMTLQYQKILSSMTEVNSKCSGDLIAICSIIELLYKANLKIHGYPLPKKERMVFYNDNFSKSLDLVQEITDWKKAKESQECTRNQSIRQWTNSYIGKFSFLLVPETKIQILHLEAMMQMKDEYQTALVHQVKIQHMHKVVRGFSPNDLSADIKSAACPYLVLNVSRENIVQGTMELLRKKEKDLKKPLKVVFTGRGEQGLDLGGLQKEFFQIFFQEVFNADYGLFQSVRENRFSWFSNGNLESRELYEVIGMVIGIAIYNGVILDLQFPSVLYKKLLDLKVTLEDLEEIQPTVVKSLRELLDFDGVVEDTFCLTFRVTAEFMDTLKDVDLIPGGDCVPVSNGNRQEFVNLYVDYFLNQNIAPQFDAFCAGFHKVCGSGAIPLFDPYELELLICGSPELDFHALQKVTSYYGGFSPGHYLIKEFWRIVHNLNGEQKHKVLNFVTGSHRVPVGGLGALSFAIQRSGGNTDNLPSAMTCFNRLFLPCYSDERMLESKLILAIENCQGFGLV